MGYKEFHLIQSKLGPGGLKYTILESFHIGGQGVRHAWNFYQDDRHLLQWCILSDPYRGAC